MSRIDQKVFCANNLVGMIVSGLMEMNPKESQPEIMSRFCKSETYKQLYDFKTELWKEGPDYLAFLWEHENQDR